ncbi:MAG: prephenate dehydratase [bacterium]
MSSDSDRNLQVQRDQIDSIDAKILELMNLRISAAKKIAAIKSELEQPAIYRPEREAQVLRSLKQLNHGDLLDSDIESLFREIMSITRGSEAGLCAALLGPPGTFTEAAALQHFGSKIRLAYYPTIDEICKAAETGQTDFAVVPIENSTEGGVNATLDRLTSTPLQICGEIYLKIHHNLLSKAESLEAIQRVVSHTQALGQCRNWLNRNLPQAELVPCNSNAEGARQAAQDNSVAGIAASSAAEKFGLDIMVANIEDEPGNTTRFLVLSDRETPPSGNDKTSMLVSGRNRPGALFHLLKPLVDGNLDMTKIESRPSRSGLWEYVFFVDVRGHSEDPKLEDALKKIKAEAGLFKLLGSYPASA